METGHPTFVARAMYSVFGALEFILPARCKAANWPIDRKPR